MGARAVTLVSTVVLLVSTAVSQAEETARKLTGDEVQKLTDDSTSSGVNERGITFITYRAAGGEIRGYAGRSFSPRDDYDEGTWTVKGDWYCVQWKRWRGGNERCYLVYHRGGDEYQAELVGGDGVVVPGRVNREWRIVGGNIEDI